MQGERIENDLEVLPYGLWDSDSLETSLRRTWKGSAPLSPLKTCILLLNGHVVQDVAVSIQDDATERLAEWKHAAAITTKERIKEKRRAIF